MANVQDIGGKQNVYYPLFIDTFGKFRRIKPGAILDIAGIYSSNFTVGGRGILFSDGTSSDGAIAITLQTAYVNTPEDLNANARIALDGKGFSITDIVGNPYFQVNHLTGKTVVSNLQIGSTDAQTLIDHLDVQPYKHDSPQIDFQTSNSLFTQPSNVHTALEELAASNINLAQEMLSINNANNVKGFIFTQTDPLLVWDIPHMKATNNVNFSVYDENNQFILPDNAFPVNNNIFRIVFSATQVGKAVLSCVSP